MKYNYFPSLSHMRNSLKRSSKEYLIENSLHGVPYFADSTRPKWERGLWFLLTIASIVITIVTIIIIWNKFENNPTLTELETHVSEEEVSFPQVFLCFEGNQLNVSDTNAAEKSFYEKIYEWKWDEKISVEIQEKISNKVTDFYNAFRQWTPQCDAILENAIVIDKRYIRGKDFRKVVTPAGVCCKFNYSKTILIADTPFQLNFKTTLFPLKFYITDKFDVGPSREIIPHIKLRIPLSVQLDIFHTYVTSDFEMLSDYQRQCHYGQSTYNNCRLNCLIKDISKKCNCLPWFLKEKNIKECSLSQYSCLTKAYDKYIDCKCTLPCNFTVYRLLKTTEGFDNDTENLSSNEIILNWPNFVFRREVRFGYMDLVVSFGGIAGLFLGYSLLTSFELFYYLSFRTYCGAVLDSSRKSQNIITIPSKKVRFTSEQLKPKIQFISYNNYENDKIFYKR
ncbi:sodium channel protein Nach-like isoform X1 [Vespula squamosa]|uniref:Sodium channel protein Nach-like isoform X1 n=1 Tax=Vespula squamosa TaxID=30214 RepID=A0ABD2B7V3_VESSQ